jgi:hypothetical protein
MDHVGLELRLSGVNASRVSSSRRPIDASVVCFDLRKITEVYAFVLSTAHNIIHFFVIPSKMAPAAIVVNESPATLDRKITKHESSATRLRNNLETGAGLIVCPGVYDGLSARIALDVGFDALYMVRPPLYAPFPLRIQRARKRTTVTD